MTVDVSYHLRENTRAHYYEHVGFATVTINEHEPGDVQSWSRSPKILLFFNDKAKARKVADTINGVREPFRGVPLPNGWSKVLNREKKE